MPKPLIEGRKYIMHTRENALHDWLNKIIPNSDFIVMPLTGDASFRRYFRLSYDNSTRIIMDAPPDKITLEPFINIGKLLSKHGFLTPTIHAIEPQQGFVLLDDFGDNLFLQTITPFNADSLYKTAINTLNHMQECTTDTLEPFNKKFMLDELSQFRDWFLERYLDLTLDSNEELLLENTYAWITNLIANQPKVFIHRDYHSRNIMLLPPASDNSPRLGIIDFQDAMQGPFTYDLVSLLKDCYIQWPREKIIEWVDFFYAHSPIARSYSQNEFHRAFDLCGLQRHLRVLGTFCRLHLRDNKSNYLNHLPLTYEYMITCLETYEELRPFLMFIQNRVQPIFLSKVK